MSAHSMLPGEQWRPVTGYESLYEVSSLGRVRSLPRAVPCSSGKGTRISPGKLLSLANIGSYFMVGLMSKGVRRNLLVHRLVLDAFCGQAPKGYQACHFNGDGFDNRVSNLRWDTAVNNQADNKRNGVTQVGTRHHAARFTEGDIERARDLRVCGESIGRISRYFGMSRAATSKALARKTWVHVP